MALAVSVLLVSVYRQSTSDGCLTNSDLMYFICAAGALVGLYLAFRPSVNYGAVK